MKGAPSVSIPVILRERPAAHWICRGAFLQEPLTIEDGVQVVPLAAFGFAAEVNYLAGYSREIAGVPVDEETVQNLKGLCAPAGPVMVIACRCGDAHTGELIESACIEKFERARRVLVWATGNEVSPLGILTMNSSQSWFRPLPPAAEKRRRLGFGNTGKDFAQQIDRIVDQLQTNERYAFAVSLYHDAVHENNPHFKIARLFACLEALAAKLKGGPQKRGSRAAIRYMIGIEDGQFLTDRVYKDDVELLYDRIELAGRLRDKLFHGSQFRREDLKKDWRGGFDLITDDPETLIRGLMGDCELEISKWANNRSRARSAAEGQEA